MAEAEGCVPTPARATGNISAGSCDGIDERIKDGCVWPTSSLLPATVRDMLMAPSPEAAIGALPHNMEYAPKRWP